MTPATFPGVVPLENLKAFAPDRAGSRTAFESDSISVIVRCWELGQRTRRHFHAVSDNVIVVLEGQGTFRLGDGEPVTVGPLKVIRVPKGTPHEIVNASGQRLVNVHIYSPKLESADVVPLP